MNLSSPLTPTPDRGDAPFLPCSPTFYGVYNGSPDPDGRVKGHVYNDIVEALKFAKKFKTCRFKIFSSFEEAENFALRGPEFSAAPVVSFAGEKSSPFKAPISQELVKFRKDIEVGDFNAVVNAVGKNPRYLVSSGDTPAILQEGARYNAMHIVAKFNRPKICEFILHCITSPEFIQRLYGEEEIKDTIKQRCDILLDLYLNTPDKAANETPLHFAAKIGAIEIIKILVSYDKCDKSRTNKHGQKAIDIIGARKSDLSAECKNEISRLMDCDYYIAVFRPLDPVRPPVVEGPFMMSSPCKFNLKASLDSEMRMSGVAGPMKYEEALNFKKLWKRPRGSPLVGSPRSPLSPPPLMFSPSPFNKPDKVIERIGRDLCAELGVYWVEYWPFLGDYANFKKEKGVDMLEQYLASRFSRKKISNEDSFSSDKINGLHKEFDKLMIGEKPRYDTDNNPGLYFDSQPFFDCSISYSLIDKTCQVYANKLFDSLMFPSFKTFYSSLSRCQELLMSCATDRRYEQVEFDRIHSKIAILVKGRMSQNDSLEASSCTKFLTDFITFEGQALSSSLLCMCKKIIQALNCGLEESVKPCERGHDKCVNENTAKQLWLSLEPCNCWPVLKLKARSEKLKKPSSITKRQLVFKSRPINKSLDVSNNSVLDRNVNKMELDDCDSDSSYKTPPSSPRLSYRSPADDIISSGEDLNSSSEDEMLSADEGSPITIEGDCYKDIDKAVYQALDQDIVEQSKHPYLYLWLQECRRKYNTCLDTSFYSPLSICGVQLRADTRGSLFRDVSFDRTTPLKSK